MTRRTWSITREQWAKERKKIGCVDAYMEELCAIIEIKNELAAEHREDKVAKRNDLKSMEDEN
jgi:hypothetical protein